MSTDNDDSASLAQLAAKLKVASRLPLAARVAWATTVCERVLHHYSDYFLDTYLQLEMIEIMWSYVGGEDSKGSALELKKRITNSIESMSDDGYSPALAEIALGLLQVPCTKKDAGEMVAAVEYAGYAFALSHFYALGYPTAVVSSLLKLVDTLQLPFFKFANEALSLALEAQPALPQRGLFRQLVLERCNLEPDQVHCIVNVLRGRTYIAPRHEAVNRH